MGLPFQNQRGMAEIRWAEEVANSVIKRQKLKAYPQNVICGCSNACGFAYIRDFKPRPDFDTASEHYKKWYKTHEKVK